MDNANDFVQRNQRAMAIGAGAIAAIAAAIIGWFAWQKSQNEEAQKEMFQAQYYFESDSLKKAETGDGSALGFTQIADDYGMTKSGKMAHYYLGAIYLKQGKFQQAVENLEKFNLDDNLVQARAYSLLGDAHSELNQLDEAAKYYNKAADHKPNKFFTPSYLMKLAVVQEAQKDYKGAIATYDKIIDNYFESAESPEARKYKARDEVLAGN